MSQILIIDDDIDICHLLNRFLTKQRFGVDYALNAPDALSLLRSKHFDLVLCDYKLPGTDGSELLQKIKILKPNVAVIIITGYSDVKVAVHTLKHGAVDYVKKPLYPDEILESIKAALEKTTTSKKTTNNETIDNQKFKKISFGPSAQSELVKKHIDLIAPTDMSVIITGETGTGKEYVANAIHQKSKRKDKPFVAIDCGALSKDLAGSELFGHKRGAFTGALQDKEGSFQLADGGTLFLDEIANLSYENQIKLLRVLQERTIRPIGSTSDVGVDVRVIVATNEDLKQSVKQGTFREDIYHRLNEFQISLTNIRNRPEDVVYFAKYFLSVANRKLDKNVLGFSDKVIELMKSYSWPGNLRELQNVIKRSVLLCTTDMIAPNHLPDDIRWPDSVEQEELRVPDSIPVTSHVNNLKDVSQSAEKLMIVDILKQAGYNKSRAAKLLNIDRKTLYNKLKAYDITL